MLKRWIRNWLSLGGLDSAGFVIKVIQKSSARLTGEQMARIFEGDMKRLLKAKWL